MPWLSAVDI